MARQLLRAVASRVSTAPSAAQRNPAFAVDDVVWAMGSFCALNRKPFDAALLVQQFPPPHSADSFIHAARALGFRIKRKDCDASLRLAKVVMDRCSPNH